MKILVQTQKTTTTKTEKLHSFETDFKKFIQIFQILVRIFYYPVILDHPPIFINLPVRVLIKPIMSKLGIISPSFSSDSLIEPKV